MSNFKDYQFYLNLAREKFDWNFDFKIEQTSFFKNEVGTIFRYKHIDGLLSGIGQILWSNESFFVGESKECLPDGLGILKQSQEVVYAGYFKQGWFNGKGVIFR